MPGRKVSGSPLGTPDPLRVGRGKGTRSVRRNGPGSNDEGQVPVVSHRIIPRGVRRDLSRGPLHKPDTTKIRQHAKAVIQPSLATCSIA